MNLISMFNSSSSNKQIKVDEREFENMRGQLAAINRVQGVIEFALDGTIITANQNFLDVMGYSLEEIKGKHHSMFVDVAYKNSQEYRLFWDRLGRGDYEAGQFKRVGRGGKEVWIQASYNPILNAENRPFKVVKYATEITSDVFKKIDIEQQMNRVLGALGSTSSNVMVADPDRKIIYLNKSVEKMLRVAEPELRKALPHFRSIKSLAATLIYSIKTPHIKCIYCPTCAIPIPVRLRWRVLPFD